MRQTLNSGWATSLIATAAKLSVKNKGIAITAETKQLRTHAAFVNSGKQAREHSNSVVFTFFILWPTFQPKVT